MGTSLLLPKSAYESVLYSQREKAFDPFSDKARKFTKRLRKELDDGDKLTAGYVYKANVPGLTNYCWHIRRKNSKGPDTYLPMVNSEGKRLEPGAEIIRQLQEWDTWSRNRKRPDSAQEAKEQARLAVEKEDARTRELRQDELKLNTRVHSRTGMWEADDRQASYRNRARGRRGDNNKG